MGLYFLFFICDFCPEILVAWVINSVETQDFLNMEFAYRNKYGMWGLLIHE